MTCNIHEPATVQGHPFETRESPRVAIGLEASLRISHLGSGLRATLRDIGVGGVCIQTVSPWALQDLRSVSVALGPDEVLQLEARGLWQKDSDIEGTVLTGAQFVDPDASTTARLQKLVHDTAQELATFLQSCAGFRGAGLDEALDLALFSRLRELPPGRYLSPEKESLESIYFIRSGEVCLLIPELPTWKRFLTKLGPGEMFGGLPLVTGGRSPVAVACQRATVLLELSGEAFRFLERAKPMLADRLRKEIVGQNMEHFRAAVGRLARKDGSRELQLKVGGSASRP